jgi:hypothetical protein
MCRDKSPRRTPSRSSRAFPVFTYLNNPDRPCICKGVARGCLQERAGTRHFVSQLAFFARTGHNLSGNATPLQKMQIKVWTPSDCHASSQAGSSQDVSRRVRSWKHTDAGRSRVNGFVPNLGRNLSPLMRFLGTPDSAAFNGTARQPSPCLHHPV